MELGPGLRKWGTRHLPRTVATWACALSILHAAPSQAALWGDHRLPPLDLPSLQQAPPKDSGRLAGQVVLVVLWAPWCTVCHEGWPELVRLHAKYAPSGLRIVGLTVDAPISPDARETLARELALPFPLLVAGSDIRRAFRGVRGYPTLFLADREGRIRRQWSGPPAPGPLETALVDLLAHSSQAEPS